MTRAKLSYVVLAIVITIAGGAPAAAVDWSATGHNDVSVTFSEEAGKCGIRSKDEFAKQLRGSLGEIGQRVDPSQPLVAQLHVSAKPVQAIQGQCVAVVRLAFVIPMEMDFIEITEKVTNREAVISVLEKARQFPIVLYENSEFTAAWPTNMHSDALYLVEQLVQQYAGRR